MGKAKYSVYIHTIEGRPAYFSGDQIYFCNYGTRLSEFLVDSLEQIRKEQEASREWRLSKGFKESPGVYGYLRLRKDR